MKSVSQNTPTIYSATTPENNPPQFVASLVPDEQRISFWPQHFGLIPQWVTLEPRVFGWMDRLCSTLLSVEHLSSVFWRKKLCDIYSSIGCALSSFRSPLGPPFDFLFDTCSCQTA